LPPPPAHRSPQEQALEQALGRFHGAPYRSGGTDPSGVDCSGLIQATFHQVGVNLPRTVAKQYGQGQPVARHDLRFGDVIFFNRFCQTKSRNYYLAGMLPPGQIEEACHNGIYLGHGRFIHASPRGVYIGNLDAEVWTASFLGARRYLPNGPPER
jgi:cell wall-associated NlpC family hydrolase